MKTIKEKLINIPAPRQEFLIFFLACMHLIVFGGAYIVLREWPCFIFISAALAEFVLYFSIVSERVKKKSFQVLGSIYVILYTAIYLIEKDETAIIFAVIGGVMIIIYYIKNIWD